MPVAGGEGTSSGIRKPGKPKRPTRPSISSTNAVSSSSNSFTPAPPKITPHVTPSPIRRRVEPSRPNFVPNANISAGRVSQAPTAYGPVAPGRSLGLRGISTLGGTTPVGRADSALDLVQQMVANQGRGGFNPVMPNDPPQANPRQAPATYSGYAASLEKTDGYQGYANSLQQTRALNPINSDSPANPDRVPSRILTEKELARKIARRGGFGLYGVQSPIEGFDFDADTNTFGPRIHPITGRNSQHTGEDMSSPMGTPVEAPAGGVVKSVSPNAGAYGMQVIIDHGNGEETMYGHLSDFNVKVGDKVRQGDIIGAVGSTGLSTGPHLHWETWKDGKALDPNTVFDRGAIPEEVIKAAREKFGGPAQIPVQKPVAAPQQRNELAPNNGLNALMQAIREQESGGNYGVQNGIGAMGAYQIMPSNIEGPAGWDMEALGRNITGQEFLSNPDLQNSIARFKLRNYFKQFGAAGAAKAWYAGPGNANLNSDAPQYGGPSVNDYSESVLALLRKYLGQ